MKKIEIALAALLILVAGNVKADNKEYPSYPELGIILGLGVHPAVGYWWGRMGIRFSGMYKNKDDKEYHLNFGYVLRDTGKVQQSINLLTSRIVGSDPGADYDFAATGIAYGLNYNGFFFEIGLGIPWRDEIGNVKDDPVVPVGYLGYVHRFKPTIKGL